MEISVIRRRLRGICLAATAAAAGCLLAACAAQSAPIGGISSARDYSIALPPLRPSSAGLLGLDEAAAADRAAVAPVSLLEPDRRAALSVLPTAIFGGRLPATDWLDDILPALEPITDPALPTGPPGLQTIRPFETSAQIAPPRRFAAGTSVSYRGDPGALLPLGTGVVGLIVIGRRR